MNKYISLTDRYIALLLVIAFSGCTIPIKLIPYEDPKIARQEEYRFKEKQFQKEQLEKKHIAGYNRIQKLKLERLKKKELLRQPKTEEEIILQSFKDSDIILKSFEKIGCSIFDIAGFLNEYGKLDIGGFCDFLADKYPFNTRQRWALDREIFIPAKRNYLLLKFLNKKEEK